MANSEIDKLINEISKLPGLGRRSAQRIALYLLKNKERSLLPLAQSLQEANQKIINCEICGNIDISSPCRLCILYRAYRKYWYEYHDGQLSRRH